MTLLADEAVHVVFRGSALKSERVVPERKLRVAGTLDGPWQVSFQSGRGAPAQATMAQLQPLDRNPDSAIAHFSGIATYRRSFTAPAGFKPGQTLKLDLGEAREIAEVVVNGRVAGHAWHAPWIVDIGRFARQGRNRVEIRVANLWVNRLIGDAAKDAAKVTWTAFPTYRADAPLRRSGLIGPVSLLTD